MKDFISNSFKWIRGTFEKDSNVSSKRITGIMIINWSLLMATYVIWKCLHGTEIKDIATVNTLITYILGAGVVLLGGGTIAEGVSDMIKKVKKKDE